LRNALPTRTWDRDYTTGSSLYSGRSTLGDSKSSSDKKDGESRSNGLSSSSYAAGGYRANNISPSKSPARDSLYDRKSSSLVEGQCGLWNIGNTCFMNSVLQCLSHTQDLSKFSRSSSAPSAVIDKGSTSSTKDQKIWTEFCKLMTQMWQLGAKSVNPSDLKMALSSKYRMYSGSAQQDAQEFLRYLLDALHGAMNKGGQKISLHVDDDMR
jgi:ubiquitin carboxyl-terminal hydrolase 2/21